MILENGLIRTLDPQIPTQRALAVAGEWIAGGVGVHETALASPEVVDLGGRVAVLAAGRLEQVGAPEDLYERPASLFVATFVGRANVFRGAAARALGGADGQVAVVRPEAFRFSEIGIPGVVKERRYTGAAAFYLVDGDRGERFEVLAAPGAARVGDRVFLETAQVLLFPEERE